MEALRRRSGSAVCTGIGPGEAEWLIPAERSRRGRWQPDLLVRIFDEEVVRLLELDPALCTVDLFHKLLEVHPALHPGVRRPLERRIRAGDGTTRPEPSSAIVERARTP